MAGALATPLALAAGALGGGGGHAVIVRNEHGKAVARAELPEDGRFALAYRHSYYRAPAQERFVADGDGFKLESVASPRAAVLDYYQLEGSRQRDGDGLRLFPRERRRYRQLPLIATAEGRRTLVVDGRRTPLYGRRARHLEITVEGS